MPIGLQGELSTMPLKDVVVYLGNRRATGVLTMERDRVKKSAVVKGGFIRATSSNDPREYLGQFLLNLGHITENQFEKAYQTQQETKIFLGQILVMTGEASEEVVKEGLALKARETLLEAFQWAEGSFTFSPAQDDAQPPEGVDLEVDLMDVHEEAEFREMAWKLIRAVYPTGAIKLRVNEDKLEGRPKSMDDRILALVRQGFTIDEMILSLHATDFFLYQRLFALHRDGIVAPLQQDVIASDAEVRIEVETPSRASGSLDAKAVPMLQISTRKLMSLEVTAPERYLLSRIDGSRTVEAIVRASPLREPEGVAFFGKFIEQGLVKLSVGAAGQAAGSAQHQQSRL